MKKLTNKLTNSGWITIDQADNTARFQSSDKSSYLTIQQTGKDEYDVAVDEYPYNTEYYEAETLEDIVSDFC